MVRLLFTLFLDIAVLENYHIAESSKLIMKHGLLDELSKMELRLIRRRMIDAILATDMATHTKNINQIKSKTEAYKIRDGENLERLQNEDLSKLYENQQMVLSFCLHCADISNPAKPFVVYRKWVSLIFEEFFEQGDREKEEGLPITVLCDRESTNIPKSQIGFINFVVIPSFQLLLNYIPHIEEYHLNILNNLGLYEEIYRLEEAKKSSISKKL